MGLTIKGSGSTNEMAVNDAKAAHVTMYDTLGNEINPNVLQAGIVIDDNNTTTISLGAGASFIGVGTDILNYNQINVVLFGRPGVVAGDGSSAMGTLFMDFSKDNSNWDITIPSLVRDPSLIIPVPLINVHKYFRVRYYNDGGVIAIAALGLNDIAGVPTAQTAFRLTCYLLPLATKELVRTMDQGISGSDPCALVRAGVMGKNPENQYVNLPATGHDNGNKTDTLLAAAAVWTGEWEETIGYSNIVVALNTDQIGTITIEFGDVNFNIHPTVNRTFTNINSGQIYIFVPGSHYYRLKFTNTSAVNQTYLHIHSNLQASAVGSIFNPADTPLSKNSLAQTVVTIASDGVKTTYSASVLGLGPVLVPTDVIGLIGSATKTIRLLSFKVSATKTSAAQIDIQLLKRSTANTLGVPTSITKVSRDSNNIVSTATVNQYTVNPTLGTLVGILEVDKLFLPATGTATDGGTKIYKFGDESDQAAVLRGVGESINFNLNAVTATGGSFNVTFVWTEE